MLMLGEVGGMKPGSQPKLMAQAQVREEGEKRDNQETQLATTKIRNQLASWFPCVGCRYVSVMGRMTQLPSQPCQVREGLDTRNCRQKRDQPLRKNGERGRGNRKRGGARDGNEREMEGREGGCWEKDGREW